MRLKELSNDQLIRLISDDAVAREVYRRLCIERMRVSDEVEALELRIERLQTGAELASILSD